MMETTRLSRRAALVGALLLATPACVADDRTGDDNGQVTAPVICSLGQDCPVDQGCGSDGLCHEDGECTAPGASDPGDASACDAGEICYNAGNDDPSGFCASSRPSVNPYCRADGEGACRYRCYLDGTCQVGATCEADGFCHLDDECTADTDCTPNHVCEELFDYGYSTCTANPAPSCIDDGSGVCRLACEADPDCLWGGGCADDGFCHASNECDPGVNDCGPDLICYEDENFGGLCGPERPM